MSSATHGVDCISHSIAIIVLIAFEWVVPKLALLSPIFQYVILCHFIAAYDLSLYCNCSHMQHWTHVVNCL